MSLLTEAIIITIIVLSCLVVAYATDHKIRQAQKRIAETSTRIATLRRSSQEGSKANMRELERSLGKLREGLREAENSSLFPLDTKSGSLSEKIRSSLPYIIGITIGSVLGVLLIVYFHLPVILLVGLFTLATFVGSMGFFLEFTRGERKAVALSTIPAGLYVLTQILVILGLFDYVFWLFDIVVIITIIGASIIIGKELPLEVVIIIVAILSIWDIYAVLATNIMENAVLSLPNTLFSIMIPAGLTNSGLYYGLIGGGDLFFSYLLVTTFTRRLKAVPVALVALIAASILGLTVVMVIFAARFAPALPSVLTAGLLSSAYYLKRLKKSV
ncbi:MAG: hypothetical protein WED05_05435 [Candidatus Atabeyarchaeum deiterrae]